MIFPHSAAPACVQLTVALQNCARQITLAQHAFRLRECKTSLFNPLADSPLDIDSRRASDYLELREHKLKLYASADFNHNSYDISKINVIPRHTSSRSRFEAFCCAAVYRVLVMEFAFKRLLIRNITLCVERWWRWTASCWCWTAK